jgi:hypothetical protein
VVFCTPSFGADYAIGFSSNNWATIAEFNHGLVILHEKVLDMQLRAFRKHFSELGERAGNEVRLRIISPPTSSLPLVPSNTLFIRDRVHVLAEAIYVIGP